MIFSHFFEFMEISIHMVKTGVENVLNVAYSYLRPHFSKHEFGANFKIQELVSRLY